MKCRRTWIVMASLALALLLPITVAFDITKTIHDVRSAYAPGGQFRGRRATSRDGDGEEQECGPVPQTVR